ncbi:DNA alkylation repair protein [Hwanghaeella grinnelliae]|uniref:DNA alkylation repair protein n=2 Tax=Hwanghaeella grinnelliae TaxID=2500179 RepID=A0A3S2W5K0_9PROT|nr:DNA alkylation repair protein [Hwanghaeella grinnelliae]
MEPFKNSISPSLVKLLSGHIRKNWPAFDEGVFLSEALDGLEGLELKARVDRVADGLLRHLPPEIKARSSILRAVLHPQQGNSPEQTSDDTGMRGFAIWPLSLVAGRHGLDNLDVTLDLLKDMTKRFSSEFGIRYPLIHDQDRVLSIMSCWLDDPDPAVRRLVSEGTRPRLPWAQQLPRLIADPTPALPLLHRLRDDPSEYVRRSVANHLNDISKDHPALVADLAADWMKGADDTRRKLIRHACRSLIKAGNPDVLTVFGHAPPELSVEDIAVSPQRITLGESIELSARIVSTAQVPQSLVIDYVARFLRANGSFSEKVFKGSSIDLPPNGEALFRKKIQVRPITTRRYYPGIQHLNLRINGKDFGDALFDLHIPD